MLGKLIKHEWKATWKFPALISLFIVVMTVLGVGSLKLPFWSKLTSASFDRFTFIDLLALAVLVMYFIYIVVAVYAVMIYFSVRFYKNMYTNEGYLTHTLPVKPSAHIFSKTMISGSWYLVSSMLMLVSLFWLMGSFMNTLTGGLSLTEADMEAIGLRFSFAEVNRIFEQVGGMPFWAFAVIMVLLIIFNSYSSILIVYVCISIGQLFKKHKVIASLLTYLVVTTIMQIVLTIAIMPVMFNILLKNNNMMLMESADLMTSLFAPYAMLSPIFLVSMLGTIVFGVAAYFVTEYIMRRKLNLD